MELALFIAIAGAAVALGIYLIREKVKVAIGDVEEGVEKAAKDLTSK